MTQTVKQTEYRRRPRLVRVVGPFSWSNDGLTGMGYAVYRNL
jgi:hypothetical protein